MKNHYDLLGLFPNATPEEIKDAYRMMAMVWHPDRFSGNLKLRKFAEERFKEINGAYEVLSDPAKRRTYDEEGRFVTQKPKPVVSPKTINFGEIEHGDVVSKTFRVENQGGSVKELNFDYPPDSWFQLERITPVSEEEMFPLEVEVRVESERLAVGLSYAGSIVVDLDGEKAEVEVLIIEVVTKPVSVSVGAPSPVTVPATTTGVNVLEWGHAWLLIWLGTIGGPIGLIIGAASNSPGDNSWIPIVAVASLVATPLGGYILAKTNNFKNPENANSGGEQVVAVVVMMIGGIALILGIIIVAILWIIIQIIGAIADES